jgi:glucosamine-6-phosphate deaminase
MKVKILKTSKELGERAAAQAAEILNNCIDEKGSARLLVSTGASQFDTIEALVKEGVDWSKVEMFHLDEYIGIPESHPASFRKYLKERFVKKLKTNLKKAFYVNAEGDIKNNISLLSEELKKNPIDLGLIGIGENAHIAFNDPPADFDTMEAYIIVDLNDACRMQQVGEGWFKTINDVPAQAISMSVYQIMQCKAIISCVPYKVKANAIKHTLENNLTNMIPATMLKMHGNVILFLDEESASAVDKNVLKKYL